MTKRKDYDESYASYRRQYEKLAEKGIPMEPMLSLKQYEYVYNDIGEYRRKMGMGREKNMPRAIAIEQRKLSASQVKYTRSYVKAIQGEIEKKRRSGGQLTPNEIKFLKESTSYASIYKNNKELWVQLKGFSDYFAQLDSDYYYL